METAEILKKIVARKRQEVEERKLQRTMTELEAVVARIDGVRPFAGAISECLENGSPAVIAEVKKASPSKGVIREDFDPQSIAKSYQRGGAACLSVLTDVDFFQGADQYLQLARSACNLPVLRKDFIIDEYQLFESRCLRADCILLIAAILDQERLQALNRLARELGLEVLVEVHNELELDKAMTLGNRLLGINNRDLNTFEVDLDVTLELASRIPKDTIVVTESGIHSKEEVSTMRNAGVNSFLVGESFMRAEDPGAKLRELFFN